MNLIPLAESGWLPDAAIRLGIRRLLRKRVAQTQGQRQDLEKFVQLLSSSPLAVRTDAANEQHYEAPPEFFRHVLGPRLKYSCCLYGSPETTLAAAEEAMQRLTCERAGLADGQRILELGCGWGSLSLWMAQNYPGANITAVSNSHNQRAFIEARAGALGVENLRVVTADMVDYQPEGQFDRIVSVEMFEHMRNYELLFRRVASWLKAEGKVFVHVFCHNGEPYLFETEGADNWMGRHFFTGGTMPSADLFGQFDEDLRIVQQWRVSGLEYWRTCEDWLQNLDRSRGELLRVLLPHHSTKAEARVALQRWRMFFLACAELFRFENGDRWQVAHYLFEATPKSAGALVDDHPIQSPAPQRRPVSA
jgi:cyclopropane-fatty-acyl-phospholipid synthase